MDKQTTCQSKVDSEGVKTPLLIKLNNRVLETGFDADRLTLIFHHHDHRHQ